MTSFLPFTDINKNCSYALNVNTEFYMCVFNFCVKIIAFCIKNAFKEDNLIFFCKVDDCLAKYEHTVLTC